MDEGRKEKNGIAKLLSRVLIIGFSVQILLGVLWACLQFPHFQEFGASHFLLNKQILLLCDDYEGILYPLLLQLFLGISKVIPLPYYCFLYALQLAVAAVAAHFFLNSFRRFGERGRAFQCWMVLAILTVPFAMQCHLAVLPNSLAASAFLMQLGLMARERAAGKKGEGRTVFYLTMMGICYLAEALLLPDYRLLGGLALICAGAMAIYGKNGCETDATGGKPSEKGAKPDVTQVIRVMLVTAAILAVTLTVSKVTVTEGAYGRMGNTIQAAAMRRFAWDDFGELYAQWPAELKEALTQEEIAICNKYPERKLWILGQKVDAAYGREKAKAIYWEVAKAGMKIRAKRNLKEMLMDAACYGFAPAMHLLQLEGKGQESYAADNYEIMRMKNPEITSLYVRYGGWTFLGGMVFGLLLYVTALIRRAKERKELLAGGLAFALIVGLFTAHYVLWGGGVMDYKNVLPVMALWMAFFLAAVTTGMGEAKE